MSFDLEGEDVNVVGIIDDQPDVRSTYSEQIHDLGATSREFSGPLPNLEDLIQTVVRECQAVVCDYRLRGGDYASYDGDQIVARLTQAGIPTVMCTEWRSCADEMRARRRFIPAILSPDEMDLDQILVAMKKCANEIKGQPDPTRRPWRTLARFQDADRGYAYLVLPAWRSRAGIKVQLKELPAWLREAVSAESEYRCYVRANTGAEHPDDLYFYEWTPLDGEQS